MTLMEDCKKPLQPKCGAMQKNYLVNCKSIVQYFLFKKILTVNFSIMTNSKLLKLFLFLTKKKFITFDNLESNKKSFHNYDTKTKLFIESNNYVFDNDKLKKLTIKLDEIIIGEKKKVIFFNQYHFINQIIKNICINNNISYSEIEIDNFKKSFRVASGEKLNLKYSNYNLARNKIIKVLNFILDEICLQSNKIFFKKFFISKIIFLLNSILGFSFRIFLGTILDFRFNKSKKHKKIFLLQCSHDSSILCASKLSINEYLDNYLFKAKKKDLVVIHPEERSTKFLFLIIKYCLKNKVDIIVSIKNLLKYDNYDSNINQFDTLSSTSLKKLLHVQK
jgi:hypothetical protein